MRSLNGQGNSLAVGVDDFSVTQPWVEFDNRLTIENLLFAAQNTVEIASRHPLTERSVEINFALPSENWTDWWFPIAPVNSVVDIAVLEPSKPDKKIPLDLVSLVLPDSEPRLHFSGGAIDMFCSCDQGTIKVTASVGYTDSNAPAALKQAIILLTKEWYDAGVSIGDTSAPALSFTVGALIQQQKYIRPYEFV